MAEWEIVPSGHRGAVGELFKKFLLSWTFLQLEERGRSKGSPIWVEIGEAEKVAYRATWAAVYNALLFHGHFWFGSKSG